MGGITVIDDYAHNPAKIAASWKAVAEQHPRILGIWRPHGFGPLAAMKDELIQTWKTCARPGDRIFILPVYYAGGTTKQKVSSRDLVKALQKQQLNAEFMADYSILQNVLFAVAAPGDAILIMGARDPELPCFAKKIAHLNADGKFTANPPVAEP
jgi:UDP-N-acetylmuramate--alanine ligase